MSATLFGSIVPGREGAMNNVLLPTGIDWRIQVRHRSYMSGESEKRASR